VTSIPFTEELPTINKPQRPPRPRSIGRTVFGCAGDDSETALWSQILLRCLNRGELMPSAKMKNPYRSAIRLTIP